MQTRKREARGGREGRAARGISVISYLCALTMAVLLAAEVWGPWRHSGVTKVYLPYPVRELPVPSEGIHSGSLTASAEDPGIPHAPLMERRGLDREEYLSLLRQYTWEGEHLTFRWKGTKYQLYYVPAKRTTTPVPIPAGHGYTISGNDEDGFIAAVWEK